MELFQVFDSVTIITLSTISFTFLGLIVRTCFLSKCTKCSICFGAIEIDRNVIAENDEMKEIEMQTVFNNNNTTSNV